MRAVEGLDGAVGQLLQMGEEPVDALDAARGVLPEHLHRAVETRSGSDPLGGRGHLGFDAMQLIPAPRVDLLRVAVHAKPPSNADGVELAAHGVRVRRLRGVLLEQEARHPRVRLRRRPSALLEQLAEPVVVGGLGGDAREVRRLAAVQAAQRRRLLGADKGLAPCGDATCGQPVAQRLGESGDCVGNPAHAGRDSLPVFGRLARREVERHPDERQWAVECGQLAPGSAGLVPLEVRAQAVTDHRRGDAIGVSFDACVIERSERPAVEVRARIDAVR